MMLEIRRKKEKTALSHGFVQKVAPVGNSKIRRSSAVIVIAALFSQRGKCSVCQISSIAYRQLYASS
jgi:hypothetical protein